MSEKDIEKEAVEVNKIKRNSVATMHNKLIEARYEFTVEEQRIILALVSLIQPDDDKLKKYKIPVSVIGELTDRNKKELYQNVKKTVNRLLKKTISIERFEKSGKEEEEFESFPILSYSRYKKGEGYFYIGISDELKPYLLQLKKKFTKIPLKYVLPLKSAYSVRLYELLKQYEGTGFRIDEISVLKPMLGIDGDEYKNIKDFEKWVIKRAVQEINEKTDLEVNYVKKKTGRKITHIEFQIKSKENPPDTAGLELEIFDNGKNEAWEKIGKYRELFKKELEDMKSYIQDIKLSKQKVNVLSENELLFLLINADRDIYDNEITISIIKKALTNKNLKNPMGFLIKTLNIDINNAECKELTTLNIKVDRKLLKEMSVSVRGKSAKEYTDRYIQQLEQEETTLNLLKEALDFSIIQDNKIYIPVPDDIYKDWFEGNFLEDMKEFMNTKFGIDDVIVLDKVENLKKEEPTKAEEVFEEFLDKLELSNSLIASLIRKGNVDYKLTKGKLVINLEGVNIEPSLIIPFLSEINIEGVKSIEIE